ncbi:uncharacterized protein LOC116840888 [Odontomachus brunneus]|uniref:uncharacterized protein LOC116840888 n=1 Tax=Odontomachus brunneus TaxID=486640 RepID=UPI0013F2675A|nr:uncharacterized protein LOC116840888 [Odontomachus brunneus]
MRRARREISLADLGIGDLRTKRAATGALVLEVSGPEGYAKTDALAGRMRTLFAEEKEVRIARPAKRVELRVRDLDDAMTMEDVITAIALSGGCGPEDVKVGAIRAGANGLGTMWVQCPLASAKKVLDGGRLRVGWTTVRVEALAGRPLQCYRCMQRGHVRATYTSVMDCSGLCYRCGRDGHRTAECGGQVECPVCRDAKRSCGHRMGIFLCPIEGKRGKKEGKGSGYAPPQLPKEGKSGRLLSKGEGSPAKRVQEGAFATVRALCP